MLKKRADDFIEFFENMITDFMQNDILIPPASIFVPKQALIEE
jgi:hypothetical protein